MTESATLRESKRLQTELRITRTAQELAADRGLDGFTMDDLADAAEVSRRTLFNYFPSKLDAVLGHVPSPSDEVLDTFRAGGPTGTLIDDLGVLAQAVLAEKPHGREDAARMHRVLGTNPRLLIAVHERFETLTAEFVDLILAREGADFGADRARLVIRLFVAIFDTCMPRFIADEQDRPLAELFDDTLATARQLLA